MVSSQQCLSWEFLYKVVSEALHFHTKPSFTLSNKVKMIRWCLTCWFFVHEIYVCVRGVFNISIIIFVHVDSHVLTLAADCQLLCTFSPHLDKQVTLWRHLLFLHQYYVDTTLQQFNAYVFFPLCVKPFVVKRSLQYTVIQHLQRKSMHYWLLQCP